MPSKLPIIKANTTQINIDKMKVIANANKRSVAKELEWLIEKHIEEYEKMYGEITDCVEEKPTRQGAYNEFLEELTEFKKGNIKLGEMAKKSWKHGIDIGNADE